MLRESWAGGRKWLRVRPFVGQLAMIRLSCLVASAMIAFAQETLDNPSRCWFARSFTFTPGAYHAQFGFVNANGHLCTIRKRQIPDGVYPPGHSNGCSNEPPGCAFGPSSRSDVPDRWVIDSKITNVQTECTVTCAFICTDGTERQPGTSGLKECVRLRRQSSSLNSTLSP